MLSFFDNSPLARQQFRDWLAAQDDTVGRRMSGCDCPLARYLNSRAPTDFGWYISATEYVDQMKPEEEHKLPYWAERFVARIDESPLPEIPREVALRVLAAV